MRTKKEKKEKSNILIKIMIIVVFMAVVAVIINLAPNYIRDEITGKMNVIINHNNVTESMKFEAYVNENGIVYLATKDIANFFDEDIFYDNQYNQIITSSSTKLAVLPLEKKEMYVNSNKVKINGAATKKGGQFYLPFSEMKDVYHIEISYIKETNTLTIDSLDREQKKGKASKDIGIQYKPTIFSKTIDRVKEGDSMVVIETLEDHWVKVRTSLGKIGYTKDITNIHTVRKQMEDKKQVEGKVSLVWDYYTSNVPNRTGSTIHGINVISPSFADLERLGKGNLTIKIGEEGKEYINWAHQNQYKVWAIVSNNSYKDTTSEILNDYQLREGLINRIVNLAIQYELDGINIDFENMNGSDKEMFSRFIIELAPRLKEYGKVLSVDVTAPDGSENWSMCYDRYKIAKVADYIIFMGYDQYGDSSVKAGTTAGADWVEVNIKKFLGQEGVKEDKLILAMPFYTRLWKEKEGKVESTVVWMKNIENRIPSNVPKVWKEDVKQYYVEYEQDGTTYKMWLEEEESLKAKFALMKQYNLAGAAYWQKDFEKDTTWNRIAEELK